MYSWKVDYSELVDAVQKEDRSVVNEHFEELQPRLCAYLRATMDASPEDAEDAVQQAIMKSYSKLKEETVKAKKYFFKYLLQACRNEYLTLMKYENRRQGTPDDVPDYLVSPSEQVKNLEDEERQSLMKACIESLKEKYRDFVWYYCDQDEWRPKDVANHFGISHNNARLMKTRAIKKLSACVERKLKK